MSTHDLKLQQSSCQSGVKASVTCVVSDLEGLYAQTDKSRFQNVSEHEESHPGQLAQHIHNKKDLETRTTVSSPLLQLTGQQKSSRDLQIRQIIVLRSKEVLSRTSEEQRKSARFTSTISISLPSRRNKKDTAEEKLLQAATNLTHEAGKNTANQHHTELRDVLSPTEQCGESTGESFKNGDGPNPSFDEDSFTTLHQHGTKQRQNTGIQHNIGLHEQTQIVHKDSQRHSTQPVCEVQTEFNKESVVSDCRENAATTPLYHSNLTSLEVNNGLKACTDSQFFAHHSEVANLVLSLDSLPAPHSENTPEPEPGLINPTSAMLSSALASVLAPPWSGRLRRPKQGGSEVQHEHQDCGQNVNPSTFSRQDRQQQPFLPSQRQPSEHMLANDNDMQLTARTGYNSPDWQKENNSPNITTTIQPKRPIIKSSSVGVMYNNTDLHPFPTPLDTRQVPNLAHSGYRISNTGDEHESFKSLSSKPTTSSLLLSLRRSNLRGSSAEPTQSETQMTRSVRSLTLPSRVVLKTPSFAHPVTTDEQTPEYPHTPARTEEIPVSQFPFSPRIRSRVPLRASLFLNKPEITEETEISKRLEASVARAEEEHFPHSTTKTSQLGLLRAQQSAYSANNTNLKNSNMKKQQVTPDTTISPKVSTNFNLQQSGFNVQKLKSQSSHNIIASSSSGTNTFTDRLNYSPRKDSSEDGTSPTNIYLNSKKYSQTSQSTLDLSSPLSPSRPLRSVRVPSIYSYLREYSPVVSTPSPSTPSSLIQRGETSLPKQDGGATLQGDRKTLPSRFSFDINPFVPQVKSLQRSSYGSHVAPAQSLPPDFGRRSAPRLSTSPYSSLISSRPTLNNTLQELPSPPVSKTHTRSTSYDIVTTPVDFRKGDPSSSLSTYTSIIRRPKEQLASSNREQRTAVQAYTSALDNHRPAQPCLLQTAPDASFVMESQSANISPRPRQPDTGSNNFSHQEHDGLMEHQLDKGNAYTKHRLSEKEKYLLPDKLTVESETLLMAEKEIPAVHMHERLQEIQSSNSKKGLFSSRVKKDKEAVFSSASLPDKEVVSPQYLKTKRHSPVFRTTSRIDQMLNRLKLTFGVKRSDSSIDTLPKKNKSPTQQPLDTETFETPKTEEKTCSESYMAPSNSSLTTDKTSLGSLSLPTLKKSENALNMGGQNKSKAEINNSPNSSLTTDKVSFASFGSLSPLTLKKCENTLNMNWQNRSTTEQKGSGCTWEAPNSSLTTDKASFASLSPLTLKKSENNLNMNWQNRSTAEQRGSGCTWEAPKSSLTTDKASFASFGPLSPLPLRKSENTLNMDWQNRSTTEQKGSGYTWEAPNSSLTTDKASFASFGSLLPLTLRKSENTLNMDWQNRSTTEQRGSGCTWEDSNSSLTTDKDSFASFGSLSPLTLRKSENTLNMDWQNRSTTEQRGSGCTWEDSNSSLTTDKDSFGSLSPLTLKKSPENKLNADQQKRYSDENGNRSYGRSFSPHRLKAQNMNRSATLPHYRKSSVCPTSPFHLFDFDSEDIQNDNDNVFYSPVSKKTNSLCESDDFSPQNATNSPMQQNLVRSRLSSSCADFKYLGLHNGRTFSVSSVVSSRPSGPGRISTSSISDLSSLDDFVPKGNYTVVDSPMSSSYSPIYDAKSVTGKQSQAGYTDDFDLDHDDADPTPPPSPTMSSSPRRISQAPSVSSPIWTTPENLSPPRGILSSRSYATSLTVFEESDTDTTTDDEYYLDNGDAVETEL